MPNRLELETSPYLKQHQDNPVDWYPWGEEALALAKAKNLPILLSIGYSACHWCHVMAHESFEDPVTAQMMNEKYINIKVDREERPDLDQIYQGVAQALTRGGGWPLTVFLMPDLKPFYGGTYFPPEDRYGRPGFRRVLTALSEAFHGEPESVAENASKLTDFIAERTEVGNSKLPHVAPELSSLKTAASQLLSFVDQQNGGFGGAPKFPNPMGFTFLWRFGVLAKKEPEAEKMRSAVLMTLRKMAQGGIYDQLGGGFHRYSVDAKWSVPHFEKMLYDNALLVKLYAEVLLEPEMLQSEDKELFLKVLSESTDYLLREMLLQNEDDLGAFYSAQDADSEGEEGKFFVWDQKDLQGLLTAQEAEVFAWHYGVTNDGNYEHGKTVLYVARSVREVSVRCGLSENATQEILTRAQSKLFEARKKRIAPGLDDKVLTSWNGLMISGLVWAAKAFHAHGCAERARQAQSVAEQVFKFISVKLKAKLEGEFRLHSSYAGGKAKGRGYLDDYAFMAMAALDLSRSSLDLGFAQSCVQKGNQWIQTILKHFQDSEGGGSYFLTSDDHEKLIQRPRTVSDQAIPSGAAVALTCMAALSEIDPENLGSTYSQEVERQLGTLYSRAIKNPHGLSELLCLSLLSVLRPIVVSGVGAAEICCNPHVFCSPETPKGSDQLQVCHREVCLLPEDALGEIKAKLSFWIP